eukprot:4810259-Lingulodinium_polyedra.AAC.1
MSKMLRSWGASGLPPLSRYVRLTRCSWSGPRPARGAASASGSAGLPSQEPLPEEPPSTAGAGAGRSASRAASSAAT